MDGNAGRHDRAAHGTVCQLADPQSPCALVARWFSAGHALRHRRQPAGPHPLSSHRPRHAARLRTVAALAGAGAASFPVSRLLPHPGVGGADHRLRGGVQPRQGIRNAGAPVRPGGLHGLPDADRLSLAATRGVWLSGGGRDLHGLADGVLLGGGDPVLLSPGLVHPDAGRGAGDDEAGLSADSAAAVHHAVAEPAAALVEAAVRDQSAGLHGRPVPAPLSWGPTPCPPC